MDLITKLPCTKKGHDAIWVLIVLLNQRISCQSVRIFRLTNLLKSTWMKL
ncbi:hypothetical protein HanXRQr2_Chr02g0079161 [Helianthus annuus]|uniref:Uncharacterized protein n=1 Tax=Helianthus annuus TaxID=4232 RepID=A0A9K3JQW9_HELAN|nr:hypothetical protein HanXRQr2_Chr02g0079161 [Helianthus annuus]